MRVIAIVNQKGGVGKTTTSVNLGAALSRRGRRVLLVDMDPQGNLTDHLLGDPPEGTERASIYDVIVEGAPLSSAIVATTTPGLFVVPSHPDLAGAELDLASVIGREVILRDAMAVLRASSSAPFDYVFLDCPPSLGLLSLNALAAAEQVFIALQTEFFAMRGLGALDKTVDLVRRRINPRLEVGGIVPTLVDSTRLAREVIDEVRGHYGEKVFATRIRTNIRLAEAPSHGKHIFEYAPDSPGAADYAALAVELEEGRAAVAGPEAAAGLGSAAPRVPAGVTGPAAATAAPAVRPAPGLRGIARAIAEATAAVSAGAPAGTRGGASQVAAPPVAASQAGASATKPPPPASGPAAPSAPRAAPARAAPARAEPVRTGAVPLPVLRPGPRALPLAPMPARPLSALPRPLSAPARGAAGDGAPASPPAAGTGTDGRRT